MSADPTPVLPEPYELVRVLVQPADGAGRWVVHARADGRNVVVRGDSAALDGELRAELGVLSAVDHPALARLVAHGTLSGGGHWVARTWVEGTDLATWAVGRSHEDVGRAIVGVCDGLQHLHARGFVHGDLKAQNVLVPSGPDVRAVVTDFGLARRAGAAGDVSGSWFHVAPEVLAGAPADARSDLFALGVTLHRLLVDVEVSPRDFYGRFPAQDYFASAGTRVEELPEWAREIVARLVERDPRRRPANAEDVASRIAGRLGVDAPSLSDRARLAWDVLAARDDVLTRPEEGVVWLRVPDGEDPEPLARALHLRRVLAGDDVVAVDLAVDLERALRSRADTAAVDACLTRVGAERPDADVLTLARIGRPVERGAAETLARLWVDGGRTGILWIVADDDPRADELATGVRSVPRVEEAQVLAFLRERLAPTADSEDPRLAELAARLVAVAGGSATRLAELLERGSDAGWFVRGEELPRLRPGAAPDVVDDAARRARPTGDVALVLATVHVCGGSADLPLLQRVAGIDDGRLGAALDAGTGWLGLDTTTRRVRARVAVDSGWLTTEAWRSLHAARAADLESSGAASGALPHRVACGELDAGDVVRAACELRDRGLAEQSLELCKSTGRWIGLHGAAVPPELLVEEALAWCALGEHERALGTVAPLRARPRGRGHVERVAGAVCTARRDHAAALEHFERALELGAGGDEADLEKARLLYELRRDDEVAECVRSLEASGALARMAPRTLANLRSLESLSRFRRGEVESGRRGLEEAVEQARRDADPAREAGLRINLGTLERRAGDLDRAREHFERAAEHHERCGHLLGLAQARALLANTLRELGELSRAGPLLASALRIRERAGDRIGATSARGMLGLLHADRGHARAAVDELRRSARDLRGSGKRTEALWLDSRADEMSQRLGVPPEAPDTRRESERVAEGDPRILLARARIRALAGDTAEAAALAERAARLAVSFGHAGVASDARRLGALLSGAPLGPEDFAGTSAAAEDARLLRLLSHAPFDAEAAARLAAELAARGRDDRAARLWIALAVRGPEEERERAELRARDLLELTALGASTDEADALRRSLLGVPDPWPEDLVAFEARHRNDGDDEMEIARLLDINHRLVCQDDLSALLGTITEEALDVSGAQRGFLILERDGELEVDTALDSRRGDLEAPDVEVSGSVLKEALRRKGPIRLSNAVDDPRVGTAPSVQALDLRSILCVPFDVRPGLAGVIYVDHRLREGAFGDRAERLLSLLADQAALAIQQVERLDEIRRLNRELNRKVARKESDLQAAQRALRAANVSSPVQGLVGGSPEMQRVHRVIELAAPSMLPALVCGASGTGKELAARALHARSGRPGPFVSESCAALPPSLIESELFGAKKGAFTGADRDREGLFQRADGGTLFLDEVGELPLELQAKLLRVLETSEVRRIGDSLPATVSFRLVAATNRDLALEVAEGRFRADLLYRLDGLRIDLPDLGARTSDIPLLVEHCLRLRTDPGQEPVTLAPAVMRRLVRRPWPGNVRELFNEVERLCVMAGGDVTDPDLVREADPGLQARVSGGQQTLAELERQAILAALQTAGGDKRRAAELLGISRAKIYQRLKEWRLDADEG